MENAGVAVKRILAVEDDPAICELCQRVLSGEGIEVEIAVNGKVAQDMIEEKQYYLCLIDIRTPTMDGKELYQWLQQKHSQMAGQVIFTTGDVTGADTQDFLEKANRPFLPKPFTPDELAVIVRETSKEVE